MPGDVVFCRKPLPLSRMVKIPFPGDVEFQCDFDLVRSRMPDRASDRFLRDTVEWHRQASLAP